MRGFFAAFCCKFRTPSIWTLSPGFLRTLGEFLGAVDDQQLLVVEGSGRGRGGGVA